MSSAIRIQLVIFVLVAMGQKGAPKNPIGKSEEETKTCGTPRVGIFLTHSLVTPYLGTYLC